MAPEAFQRVINNMIGDLEGTESLLNDVSVMLKLNMAGILTTLSNGSRSMDFV